MLQERLKPFLVGFVYGHYEEVDDQLVFAYNEAHAINTILKTFKEFYKLLAKYRSQARSGFAVDQLTLIEHMGYSIWLASSGSLLIEGQKNMFFLFSLFLLC